MPDVSSQRLVIPALGSLYRALAPFTMLLIRLVAGLSLVPHGYPKLFVNPERSATFLEQSGFRPGLFWAIVLGSTEFFGGLLLAAGLFTRIVCVPIFIFLSAAVFHHSQFGFVWNNQGFEYPLFWAIVVFHFLVNGGGRCSVDAMLGREV
jgi:putative oxidoreductase